MGLVNNSSIAKKKKSYAHLILVQIFVQIIDPSLCNQTVQWGRQQTMLNRPTLVKNISTLAFRKTKVHWHQQMLNRK